MKRIIALLLLCVFGLCGCAGQMPPAEESSPADAYMGDWQIYTHTGPDGAAIGKMKLTKTDKAAFAVEITDFVGGVDITGVKNARFDADGIARSVETVTDADREIVLHFNFTKDENAQDTIVIDFIEPDSEHIYALESLYLYRA